MAPHIAFMRMKELAIKDQTFNEQAEYSQIYSLLSPAQGLSIDLRRKKFLKDYPAAKGYVTKSIAELPPSVSYSLDTLLEVKCAPPTPMLVWAADEKLNKRKTNMCYDCDTMIPTTDTERKINHLTSRLSYITSAKTAKFRKDFGLDDDDYPVTWEELIARITSGKYILSDEAKKKDWAYSRSAIKFRDPKLTKDEAGYEKAFAAKDSEEKKTEDIIQSGDYKEGLAALYAFESNTFH